MRTWIVPMLTLIMLVVPSVYLAAGPADEGQKSLAPSPYVAEDQNSVRIGNDLFEIEFEKGSKGGLSRIIDKVTGIDHRGDKEVPPTLFALFYHTGSGDDAALQWDASSVTFENSTSTNECALYINSTGFKGYDLDTSVMVKVDSSSSLARMRIEVMNEDDIVMKNAFFPLVWGMGAIGASQEDDYIFFPSGDGILLRDPLSVIDTLYFSDTYPAGASMQFMCHYDEDESGLYVATYDAGGMPKKLNTVSLDWGGEKRMSSYFQILCPEYPMNDLRMDYDAMLGTFHGDWHDAADIYSEWAHTTPFVSGGKVGIDKDTPSWWLNTSVAAAPNRDRDVVHNTLPSIVEMTRDMSDITGMNTTSLIFAWENQGGWVGPNFFPPAEGEEEFISAMDDLDSGGDRGFVYLSGTVWRISRPEIGYSNWSYFNSTGRPWAALTDSGNVLIDENYLSIGWECARMCPYTEFWHDMVVDNTLELVRLGVDVVQIDEFPIGTIYPCYNASHGHPMGCSVEMARSMISILADLRAEGRDRNPDLIISTEEPCELYLPYIDTYVSRDNAEEYMLYPFAKQIFVDQIQFVPAFGYVYHEYVTAFGEPVYIGDDYPDFFNDQIKRALARGLVQGEIASCGVSDGIWPELLELYGRTARAAATYANEYVVLGDPIRPPDLDVPVRKVEWYFNGIGAFGNPFNESVVVNGAYEAPDGSIGHILVNWDDSPHTFGLEIGTYGPGPTERSIAIARNGDRESVLPSATLPIVLDLTLQGNDVVLVEVLKASDIAVDSVSVVSTVLTNETVLIEIAVTNAGTLGTGLFDIHVSLDGITPIASVIVDTIQANGSDSFIVEWNTSGIVGSFEVVVEADPTNRVHELIEINNIRSASVQVLERPRSSFLVTVLDNISGDPIEGAMVDLERIDGPIFERSGRTNGSGACSFDRLIAGTYRFTASADDYNVARMENTLDEGTNFTILFKLDPVERRYGIRGNVTDLTTGLPIEGALVLLRMEGTSAFLPLKFNTTAQGFFTFPDLPVGEYALTASGSGYIDRTIRVVLDGDITVDIPLDPAVIPIPNATLLGSVKDSVTGSPIRATVELMSRSVMTDPSGEFSILGIPPGIHPVNVTAEGYEDLTLTVNLSADETLRLLIVLKPLDVPPVQLGRIIGKVSDEAGASVPLAKVNDPDNVTVAITDGNGSFIISGLEPGTYSYTIWASGFYPKDVNEISVNGTDVSVDIVLKPIPVVIEDEAENDDEGAIMFIVVSIFILIAFAIVLFVFISRRGQVRSMRDERWDDVEE